MNSASITDVKLTTSSHERNINSIKVSHQCNYQKLAWLIALIFEEGALKYIDTDQYGTITTTIRRKSWLSWRLHCFIHFLVCLPVVKKGHYNDEAGGITSFSQTLSIQWIISIPYRNWPTNETFQTIHILLYPSHLHQCRLQFDPRNIITFDGYSGHQLNSNFNLSLNVVDHLRPRFISADWCSIKIHTNRQLRDDLISICRSRLNCRMRMNCRWIELILILI